MAGAKRQTKATKVTVPVENIEAGESSTLIAARALDEKMSTSAKIRALSAAGHERGDIGRALTVLTGKLVRYQHVRNVLTTQLKRPATSTKE